MWPEILPETANRSWKQESPKPTPAGPCGPVLSFGDPTQVIQLQKKLSYHTSQEVVTAEKSQAGLPGQRNQPVHKTRLIIELNVSSLSG